MYKNKKFGVFGLGISGIATLKYLAKKQADFIAFDDGEATITKISNDYPEFANKLRNLDDKAWQEIDYLILSPGIPLTYPSPHKIVEIVRAAGAKIICDIELFYLDNREAYFIGITGTNGKSTTTSLITHILKYNGLNAVVGGNIGIPVLDIEIEKKDNIFVIECSSFQLDLLDKTKFNIALLLNITPDHLDRHGNMENYSQSKYKIFNHQNKQDYALINIDLPREDRMITFSAEKPADISVINNILSYENNNYQLPTNNSLLGKHNQENLAAAISACIKFGLNIEQIIAAIPSFVGLKHRMQYLGVHNGVTFINDSKATNADSSSKALASFDNIIWIAGGSPKEGGIETLKEYFPKIKQTLLIGKAQNQFAQTCDNLVAWQKCETLANAFNIAITLAKAGDVVLLSPACASYDQWKNFEVRGDAFIELFNKLKSN